MIAFGKALCCGDEKASKSLSSRESCDEPSSGQRCDSPKYVANLETIWDGDIQRVKQSINQF